MLHHHLHEIVRCICTHLHSSHTCAHSCFIIFFFNDTATTEIYTLSLHDALPIYYFVAEPSQHLHALRRWAELSGNGAGGGDRKSTRLNSSHRCISYAVFCLKKKKKKKKR